MSPLGGAVDLHRGPRRPGAGRQAGEEAGLPGGAGGRRADGWFASNGGEKGAAVEGRGVHG